MQAHSTLLAEPQQDSPVKVTSADRPLDGQELFIRLVTSCAYQLYASRGCQDGHALDDWLEAEAMVLGSEARCPLGFIDLDDVLDVEVSVGDFSAEDLEVSVDPFCLIISGDRGKTERAQGRSRPAGEPHPIFKTLSLPVEVDPSRATAELKCGMLHVVLPKKSQAVKFRARAKAA
jgi:HSP20 family molecular chaperone IbpA